MKSMLTVGTKVAVVDSIRTGTVSGYATVQRANENSFDVMYVIRLNEGEYLKSGDSFISNMLVHPDNIIAQ